MIIGMKEIQGHKFQIHKMNGEVFATIWTSNGFYHRDNWTPQIKRLARNLVRVASQRLHTFPAIGAQLVTWKDAA